MAIILSRQNKTTRLERTVIQDESYLQRYIHEHPDMLPLEQLEADIRTLVLVREFQTLSGPIDALAVDQHGNIYLIETKLYKNPDKRLVLAQVLDYGAALWKEFGDADEFISRLDSLLTRRTPQSLSQRLTEFYELSAEATTELVENLKKTVEAGEFRYVVLMDTVEDRLKNLIAYINANSAFNVLGVALDFYQHDDIDILIPTLHGAEVKKTVRGSGSRRRNWDRERFLSDAEARLSEEHFQALRSLYDWAESNADEVAFGPGAVGSINPKFFAICSRSIFTARTDGSVRLNFGWLNEPDSAKSFRDRFARVLRQNGFTIPDDLTNKWPTLPAGEWVPRVTEFMSLLSEQKGSDDHSSI
jgi:hypothetical protein